MLQIIRNRIQGWVAGFVTAIIALTFVFWGVQSYERSSTGQQQVLVTVAGKKISVNDVDELYQQWKNAQEHQAKQPLNFMQQQQLRSMALQELVNRTALYQGALQAGFQVSVDQIKQMVMQEPEFQVNKQFSEQKFQQVLATNGLTPNEFFTQMQHVLTTRQVYDGIQNSAFVLRNEMQQIYALVKQTRSFGYFLLPSSRFIDNQITDQQVNEYYQQHKNEFKTPERVKVAYILISPEQIGKTITIDPTRVKQYYEEHRENYAEKPGVYKDFATVKAEIENLLLHEKIEKRLNANTQTLSELTYTNPGALSVAAAQLKLPIQMSDWISKDKQEGIFTDPQIVKAIFSVDILQQGNNSEPIELKDGSVIVVRVDQHQVSTVQPLAAVKPQVEQILQQQLAQKKAGLQAFQIQQALQTGISVSALSKQYNLTWQPYTDSERNAKQINAAITSAVFNLAPTAQHPKPVTTVLLKNGDYAIIQLLGVKLADYDQANATDSADLHATLLRYWGQIDYQLYMQSVMANTKIKYNQQQVKQNP